jgi:UDP-3-O-[3-hydroxymyristoyl] glucosamine N-acyltransferase
LFGEMTTIGRGAAVDNLVHVAHAVRIGAGCVIHACVGIAGSATIGDGARLGLRCGIDSSVRVGEHAMVVGGSAVMSDVPAHAVAHGAPARVRGWKCVCRERLDVDDGRARCGACGRSFEFVSGRPVLSDFGGE